MDSVRARLEPLIFPPLLVAIAGIGLWVESRWHSLLLRILVAGLAVLAVGIVLRTLWKRQASDATRLSSRAWWRLGLIGVVLFVASFAVMGTRLAYHRAYGLVHPGRTFTSRTPESVGVIEYQDVSFSSTDGINLRGWYVPPDNGAVVILVHGLGGNRGQLLDDAGILVERGYGVMLFDLRNSGESGGEITTLGLLEANDVQGAVDFVLAQPGVDTDRIGLLGHSMGGATVILAAAQDQRVRAVVAQSAYTGIEDNVEDTLRQLTGLPPFPFAPLVIFFGEREAGFDITEVQPIDEIAAISPRAVMIVHGEEDELIPVANAYELYEAAGVPRGIYVIPGGRHYGLPQSEPEEYIERVVGFLDKYLLEQ
jgi:dipeptidyl aminopeptidase/acylaminoacyl peptidase